MNAVLLFALMILQGGPHDEQPMACYVGATIGTGSLVVVTEGMFDKLANINIEASDE